MLNSCMSSMKFILLTKAKMPTIFGILAFISKIHTTSESFEGEKNISLSAF